MLVSVPKFYLRNPFPFWIKQTNLSHQMSVFGWANSRLPRRVKSSASLLMLSLITQQGRVINPSVATVKNWAMMPPYVVLGSYVLNVRRQDMKFNHVMRVSGTPRAGPINSHQGRGPHAAPSRGRGPTKANIVA